jgi:hypothetical protein
MRGAPRPKVQSYFTGMFSTAIRRVGTVHTLHYQGHAFLHGVSCVDLFELMERYKVVWIVVHGLC